MMAEYIEREALETALNHRLNFLIAENGEYDHYTSGFDEAVTRVEDFPSADVAPVAHGRWEEYLIPNILCCSNCDWGIDPLCKSPYCPNCGATMDEKETAYD